MQFSLFHHVGVVLLVIVIACTISVTAGDKVGVTDPDEHAAIEEARNLAKKGKKTKRSKDDSVQQRDSDDALEATITLLVGQINSQQEVIAFQQQELVDLHDQCTTNDDPDPKEKAASFLSVQLASNCELRQLEDGQVTAVGNVGAADTYVFSHSIDSSDLQAKQRGESCGGFLWKDGVCADGLSCFTGGHSGSGRYCVPNGKAGGSCESGTDCGKHLQCINGICFSTRKQKGETCGGFLWVDGYCDDGLSCFTGGPSGSRRYCVPNEKAGDSCTHANSIECVTGLFCNDISLDPDYQRCIYKKERRESLVEDFFIKMECVVMA